MRRHDSTTQYGRLSSSATNIRSTNYSVPRSLGPSLSSYRVSNYTPSRYTSTSSRDEGTSPVPPRTTSMSGTALTRSASSSFARTPYQSPAAARTSTMSTSVYIPSASRASSHAVSTPSTSSSGSQPGSTHAYTLPSMGTGSHYSRTAVPPPASSGTLPRSRSSSSYRSVNVSALNKQAQERAEREAKDKEYSDWLEREKLREDPPPLAVPIMDFRKEAGQPSPGYSQFARAITTRSETAPIGSMSATVNGEYTSKYGTYRPVATVTPMSERERAVPAVPEGFTGLRNIGNTCFMNATLQMLVNNIELKTYFVESHYKMDINQNNPLGFRGRLAEAFADFMRQMWNGQHRAIEPVKIKELVAEKASQFANFAQHDAHEFLSFLLDGLHEDLNRIKTKPYTNVVESDGRPDLDVSIEAWMNHTARNDSIFVDLFHGQLKSRLQCPQCDRVSITFDPFVYLPVPFPKVRKMKDIYFWPLDPHLKPVKLTIPYASDGTVQDILDSLADIVRVPSKQLRMIEVFGHRVQKVYQPTDTTSEVSSGDVLYVFQLHSPSDCNESVVELIIVQRQLHANTLRYACNGCGRSDMRLKTCEACYNAYYCSEQCQKDSWNTGGHREECGRRVVCDHVGQPFVVSLPANQLTYQHLMRVIEPKCRYSVEIFQMPQAPGDESDSPTRSGSESSVREKTKSASPQSSSSASRRQSVLPEARKRREQPLFLLRKLADQVHVLGDTIVDDGSNNPLPIPSGTYISLNWFNVRHGKPYVTVDNRKQLDIDEERSITLGKSCVGSGHSHSGDPTLQQMLSMFAETERLKGDEKWYCNRCKDHVEATKKLELYRLPPVIIVQLKRFVYTATYQTMHRRSKDERRVIYPLENLDMSAYLANTAPKDQNTTYDLTGVVCHSGSSYFGHYISVGRLAGFDSTKTVTEWRTFDDSIVSKLSPSGAQNDDAYLLFYKQRGKPTGTIFRKHYSCDPTIESAMSSVKISDSPAENGTSLNGH